MKKKSSPRLKSFNYKGPYSYSLTLCTNDRTSHFVSAELIGTVLRRLKESSEKHGFKVLAYTFMPDHLHLLLSGRGDSNLKLFVKHFKQVSGYDFKKLHNEKLWHLSYYDHVLRNDEDLMSVARYIFENPVRKGYVKEYREYDFSGSFEFDITKML